MAIQWVWAFIAFAIGAGVTVLVLDFILFGPPWNRRRLDNYVLRMWRRK